MKRLLFLFLCFCMILSSVSCSAGLVPAWTEEETIKKQEEQTEGAVVKEENAKNVYGVPISLIVGEYREIRGSGEGEIQGRRLTWENINSFPIKSADMTTNELRDLCVSFFKFAKTALWIPDEDYSYIRNKKGTQDNMYAGEIYGGLPYIGSATGNIYRLMDYMDEETGVVDMSEASKYPLLFGNQCSVGSYWGWARVINSANYDWTFNMVQSRGFLRVGPYTYTDSIASFNEETTDVICNQNGRQVIYQSYAAMLPADGLVASHATEGHVMMCSSKPYVVYNSDGTINGDDSYLYITDQHQGWIEAESEAGDEYQYKNYIDRKYPFSKLFSSGYVPFTFAEFLGTDPVEETQCSFSFVGEKITAEELRAGKVTANYGISDIYVYVKNTAGEPIFYKVKRAASGGRFELDFSNTVYPTTFGKYDDGGYTVDVVCQLGTGERLTVYTGELVS